MAGGVVPPLALSDWSRPRRGDAAVGLGFASVLAAAIWLPVLLDRGFILVGDMVFVPDQPWKDRWLGADGSVPRAVPSDALVSIASQAVPGDVLQKLILVGIVVGGGYGMYRLTVGAFGRIAACAACALFVWNPFVHARLEIGHWALLCGFAALPWVVSAAIGVREGGIRMLPMLVLPLVVAAWTSPTGGALATMVALGLILATPRWPVVLGTSALCLFVNLPWIVPGLLSGGSSPDESGVAAFAAAPDTPYGVFGSLLSFGGIWKTSIVAPGRDTVLLPLFTFVLVAAGVLGLVLRAGLRSPTLRALGAVGLLGLLLAWLPATPVEPAFTWLGVHVPGAGVLRDSQKWVALWVLSIAVGAARAVALLRRWMIGRNESGAWLICAVLMPFVALPGLAWGAGGELRNSSYPADWDEVAAAMRTAGASDERTVVLPFGIYRRYPWNHDRAMLDPAQRYLPGDVVIDDTLPLADGTSVRGEDPLAARIAAAVGDSNRLEEVLDEEDVSWIVIDKDTPGGLEVPQVDGTVEYDGDALTLVRRTSAGTPVPTFERRAVILGVDLLVATVTMVLLGAAAICRFRAYTHSAYPTDERRDL